MPDGVSVELHMAFFWICDDCGRDNFVRSVAVKPEEMDARTLADLEERGFYDPDVCIEGQFQSRPDRVTCAHCNAEFHAVDPEPRP